MRITTTLTAAICLAALCAASAKATPPAPPLPPEVWGTASLTNVVQGKEDLRRTRDELFGQTLTLEQHQYVESFRLRDPDWWLDANRTVETHQSKLDLMALLSSSDVIAARQGAAFHSRLFGVKIDQVDPATLPKGARVPPISASYDGLSRPDLYSLPELVEDLTSRAWDVVYPQGQQARAAFVQQLLEGQTLPFGTSAIDQQAIWAEMGKFLDSLATEIDNRLTAHFDGYHNTFALSRGLGYDEQVQQTIDQQAKALQMQVLEEQVDQFLAALDPALRNGLVHFATTTLLPTLRTTLTDGGTEQAANWVRLQNAIYSGTIQP